MAGIKAFLEFCDSDKMSSRLSVFKLGPAAFIILSRGVLAPERCSVDPYFAGAAVRLSKEGARRSVWVCVAALRSSLGESLEFFLSELKFIRYSNKTNSNNLNYKLLKDCPL